MKVGILAGLSTEERDAFLREECNARLDDQPPFDREVEAELLFELEAACRAPRASGHDDNYQIEECDLDDPETR